MACGLSTKMELELESIGFWEERKLEYPAKKLSEQIFYKNQLQTQPTRGKHA